MIGCDYLDRPFNAHVEVLYCDFCGERCGRRRWVIAPYFRFRCRDGCSTLREPPYPSYECWRQTGQWRFGQNYHRDLAPTSPSSSYVFQLDAARCDFCGGRGTQAVWTGFPPPANRDDTAVWLMACVPCRDRWEADHPDDAGFAKLTIEKEPPEFPVYVGWDGAEHGEYWG